MGDRAPFYLGEFIARFIPFNIFLSIRTRVIATFLILVGAALFYLAYQLTADVRPRYLEVMEETMVDTANLIAVLAEGSFRDGKLDPLLFRKTFDAAKERRFNAQIYDLTKEAIDLRVYITDATGKVIFDSQNGEKEGTDFSQWRDVYLTLQGKYGARSTREDEADQASSILYVAAPIHHQGAIAGVVSLAKPVIGIASFMDRTTTRIIYLAIISALSVALLGALFSAWITYPIRNLTEYALAVRDGTRAPLPYLGHSEIRTLGLAFEEMRDALEGKDAIHRYVQTLTHEMKSPVAAIQGAAELLQEPMPEADRARFLANIRMETVRLQEGIDDLLLLASIESRKTLDATEPLDFRTCVEESVKSIAQRAALRSVTIERDFPEQTAMVNGDAFLLQRTLCNLLENAIAFTPEGSCIRVRLHQKADEWVLTVDDSGPGIPDYALPRIFERFYSLPRPDTGKKSSGLGLVFAREVTLLHGGELTLENRPEGGARALLRLPAMS